MIQADANRWEEYNSLRMESVQLLAHGRNILTATATFLIVSFAWYLNQPQETRIAVSGFAAFGYIVLLLSAAVYTAITSQALRIGGFLAVFWESSDPDRRLMWHRFNRYGATGVFVPDTAVLIYVSAALSITALIVMDIIAHRMHLFELATAVILFGLAEILIFTRIGRYIRGKRDAFEREWVLVRASREDQADTHRMYEAIPAA